MALRPCGSGGAALIILHDCTSKSLASGYRQAEQNQPTKMWQCLYPNTPVEKVSLVMSLPVHLLGWTRDPCVNSMENCPRLRLLWFCVRASTFWRPTGCATIRSRHGLIAGAMSSRSGASVSSSSASTASRTSRGGAGPRPFPPQVRAEVIAMACALPAERGLPLSRWSAAELAREAVTRGICEQISDITVWRWLSADAIRPWQHRSWIFPRDPRFAERAAPILDLYHGLWQGERLHPGDYVVCADEKPSIQARKRIAPTRPARPRAGQKVEHEYERRGRSATSPPGTPGAPRSSTAAPPKTASSRSTRSSTSSCPSTLHDRTARLPGRRQRLRPPRQTLDRPPPRRLAEPDRRAHPDPRQLAQPGRDLLLRRATQSRHPTTSPTSTRSKPNSLPSPAATNRSPNPSAGRSPATISTPSSRKSPTTPQHSPPDPTDTSANFRFRIHLARRLPAMSSVWLAVPSKTRSPCVSSSTEKA